MDSEQRTAVLLDQYPLWLEAVDLVARGVGIEVISKTTSPSVALALVAERTPALLVADVEVANGELDGLTVLSRAPELAPGLRTVALAAGSSPALIDAAFAAGAAAFVIKTVSPEDLAAALRQTFEHSVFIGARAPAVHARTENGGAARLLTHRELEILRLVAEGHPNSEVAKTLWVTEQTVKFHLSNIYRKLGVANRTEASFWAQRHGLLPVAGATG